MSGVGAQRRTRSWRGLVIAAFISSGVAVVTANSTGAAAVDCTTQVNDTVAKLVPCITTGDLWNHMVKFQAIADANPDPMAMRRATLVSLVTRHRSIMSRR